MSNPNGTIGMPAIIGVVVIIILVIGISVVLFLYKSPTASLPKTTTITPSQITGISTQTSVPQSQSSNKSVCVGCLTEQQYASLLHNSTYSYLSISKSYGTSSTATNNSETDFIRNIRSAWFVSYVPNPNNESSNSTPVLSGELVYIMNDTPHFYSVKLSNMSASAFAMNDINRSFEGMEYTYMGSNYSNTSLAALNGVSFLAYSGNYLITFTASGAYVPENQIVSYIANDLKLS